MSADNGTLAPGFSKQIRPSLFSSAALSCSRSTREGTSADLEKPVDESVSQRWEVWCATKGCSGASDSDVWASGFQSVADV